MHGVCGEVVFVLARGRCRNFGGGVPGRGDSREEGLGEGGRGLEGPGEGGPVFHTTARELSLLPSKTPKFHEKTPRE